MAVVVEMQNTGNSAAGELKSLRGLSTLFAKNLASGESPLLVLGGSDDWVEGPAGFERIYTLTGSAGEHQPEAIRFVLLRLLPPGG